MNLLLRLKAFIDERDQKKFYRSIGGIIGFFVLFFGFLFYWHLGKATVLQKELAAINKKRNEVRAILGEYEHVITQKNNIKKVLEEDTTFRIKKYFDQAVAELNLKGKVSKAEVSEPQDLHIDGYNEIRLDCSFTGMTMQELVLLLDGKIEKSKRIYTKELVITKASGSRTFDVTLVLATLQSRPIQL